MNKDILGNEYGIGDKVAAAINGYNTPTLLVGTVLGFTDQRVKLKPVARTNWSWTENRRTSYVSTERVVLLEKSPRLDSNQ